MMSSCRDTDTWREIVQWCPMSAWVLLWATGNRWIQTVLLYAPHLTGKGYYFPILQQFTGLSDLDLSIDHMLPEALLLSLPINIRTLKLCMGNIVNTTLLPLPPTLTDLTLISVDRCCDLNLALVPLSLTRLHIEGCRTMEYQPQMARPALLSLTVIGTYDIRSYDNRDSLSITALRSFLITAPSLTDIHYSGDDCGPFTTCDLLPHRFPHYQQVRNLSITSKHHIPEGTVAALGLLTNATISLSCWAIDHLFPHNITALNVRCLSAADVPFLPHTLRSLTCTLGGQDTSVLAALPSLEELDLTAIEGMSSSIKFAGDFLTLRTLILRSFTKVMIPNSVTSLTVKNDKFGGRYKFTSPLTGQYQVLDGISTEQLKVLDYSQIACLTSLRISNSHTDLPKLLNTLPQDQLRKLVISSPCNVFLPLNIAHELFSACCRFDKLELLSVDVWNYNKANIALPEFTPALVLPPNITDLKLNVHTTFKTVTFPPSLTKLVLDNTDIAVDQLEQLRNIPLRHFYLKTPADETTICRILMYLPHRISEITIRHSTYSDVLRDDTGKMTAYRAHRKRFLRELTVYRYY